MQISSQRNSVLDLMRGYFLTAILISHFYKFPSPFILLNGRGELWVSAAPGFVFISGLLVGLVYKRKIQALGYKGGIIQLIKRGLKLHAFNIFFTVSYSMLGVYIGRWQYLNKGLLYQDFFSAFTKALTFQYSYGWADLLIYYSIMLLFISPLVITLFHRGIVKPVIAVSFMIWLAMFILPGTQAFTGSYLPVESWQFLFVLGLTGGYFKEYFASLYRKYFHSGNKRNAYILILLFVTTLALSVADRFYSVFGGETKRFLDIWFKKSDLAPGLLLTFFIWFTSLYYVFQKFQNLISRYLGWLFYPYGKNSLLTYSVQSVFLFIQYYMVFKNTVFLNTVYNFVMILVVLVTVKCVLWVTTNPRVRQFTSSL
jgi:hypothetical protein